MATEEWRDIEGYEGYYQISSLGRARSIPRIIPFRHFHRNEKGKILSKRKNKKGYVLYMLCKNGVMKSIQAHRLVVAAFIGKIPPSMVVNHKNLIKADNRLENLEICTASENTLHSFKNGRKPTFLGKSGHKHPTSKAVLQFSPNGVFIKEFGSISEASRVIGVDGTGIGRVCRGNQPLAKGFKWKYKTTA